jgi:hypothetical protein
LASEFLCSEAPCVWFRGLRRLDLPPAARVFRLRLALDLFVLVFFLFACGTRTSSVQMVLASLASVHRRRQNASSTQLLSHIDLLQCQRLQGSAAVVGR